MSSNVTAGTKVLCIYNYFENDLIIVLLFQFIRFTAIYMYTCVLHMYTCLHTLKHDVACNISLYSLCYPQQELTSDKHFPKMLTAHNSHWNKTFQVIVHLFTLLIFITLINYLVFVRLHVFLYATTCIALYVYVLVVTKCLVAFIVSKNGILNVSNCKEIILVHSSQIIY